MATISKTPSKIWKAVIRKRGWPVTIKTFCTRRDAADWARRTEDEMVRGAYIHSAGAEKLLFAKALDRYLGEVSSGKRPSTTYAESHKAKALTEKFDAYSLCTPRAGTALSSSTRRRSKTRASPGRRAACSRTCGHGPTTGRSW